MITVIGILVGQWKRIRKQYWKRMPYPSAANQKHPSTVHLHPHFSWYYDWIPQAASMTEIFMTAITLELNLPPNRAIESSLASTNESTMFATSASLTKLVSSTQLTSLASSTLSRLLYAASAVLVSSATSATDLSRRT